MSESELLAQLADREPSALPVLYDQYVPAVWRMILSRVDDRHQAEDLVSETILALLRHVESAEQPIRCLSGWLHVVATRRVQNHFRTVGRMRKHLAAHQRSADGDGQADPGQLEPWQQHAAGESRDQILRVLDALPEQQRAALQWKYFDDVPVRDIAERLEVTEKAAEAMLYRARTAFRRLFKKQQVAGPVLPQRRGRLPTAWPPGPRACCGPLGSGPVGSGPLGSGPTCAGEGGVSS